MDLFSGCGGLSLGVWEAFNALRRPFVVSLAVDSSVDSLAVFCRNIPTERAVCADIGDLLDGRLQGRPTRRERALLRGIGEVDVLMAGPPCQGNSDLNNHTRRADQRNRLYERVARFVELAAPTAVVIENVPTVVHGREGAFQTTIAILERLGYAVDAAVVDAAELGVAQHRKRHVLLAARSRVPSISEALRPHRVLRPRSVLWAIGDLAAVPARAPFDTPSSQTEENAKRIAYLHEHDAFDLPNRLRPPCHRDGDHSYKSMYGRLHPDLPAQTITSGFGSPGQGRFIHPTRRRTLTPHEAARLQSFPDWFDFQGVPTRRALAMMIGNAVPPKLAFVLALHLIE